MPNNSVEGLMQPTQIGFQPGAGTPRDSAIQFNRNNNQLQAQANNALSGGRLRRKRYRGGDANKTISVSQFTMPYPETSGFGTGVNSQVKGMSQTSTQAAANAALDQGATQIGGNRRRRSRKGGNPDWVWGCMSGGKKRSRKNTKRTRKHRKSRKHRKH
jgi:hypothetical protein